MEKVTPFSDSYSQYLCFCLWRRENGSFDWVDFLYSTPSSL